MDFHSPQTYTLIISGNKENRVLQKKQQNGIDTDFKYPVTKDKCPKIYILKHNDEIVYVGYTGQSMTARLSYGFKVNGENGYYGYKWKVEDELELIVFVFEQQFQEIKHITDTNLKEELEVQNRKYKEDIEAIEAEIVFLVRNEYGYWPKYQNEIHFNNSYNQAKQVAGEIYSLITF